MTAATDSPFLAFLVGLFVISGAFALWIELLMREAAVYVIVLMLPLAFAAMVWPARRIWAVRAVELLVALILSKFAIVAVLSLGGAAISASTGDQSVAGVMAGAVLVLLAAFSPWAMLRFVPMAELASGAAGGLRGEVGRAGAIANDARVLRGGVERDRHGRDAAECAGRRDGSGTAGAARFRSCGRPSRILPDGADDGSGSGGWQSGSGDGGGGPAPEAVAVRLRRLAVGGAAVRLRTSGVPLRSATVRGHELEFSAKGDPHDVGLAARGSVVTGERLTYRFGPLERRGLFGQLRGGQAAAVATGAAAAIVVLDRAPSAAGAFLGTLLVARRAASRVRAARPPHRRGMGAGGARVLAPARARTDAVPLAGTGRRDGGDRAPGAAAPVAPPSAAGRSARGQGRPKSSMLRTAIGRSECSASSRGRRLTAVLACRVLAFSLLDAEAQERRLARWGLILAGAAAGPVRRIQWIERTAPAQGDELARWLHRRARPGRAAAGHADDRVLPRADRLDDEGHAGARGPDRRPDRRSSRRATAATTDRHGLWSSRPSGSRKGWRRPR